MVKLGLGFLEMVNNLKLAVDPLIDKNLAVVGIKLLSSDMSYLFESSHKTAMAARLDKDGLLGRKIFPD